MREIVYMPLDKIPAADRNPKAHDLGALVVAIATFGYAEPGLLDERTGKLIGGHGRLEALRAIRTYRAADGGIAPESGGHLATKAAAERRNAAAAAVREAGHDVPAEAWERYDEAAATGPEDDGAPDGVLVDDECVWAAPVVRGWSSADDDEAAALLIALNRLGEKSGWDAAALADMFGGVDPAALEVAGYTPEDVEALGLELEAAAAAAAAVLADEAATAARQEADRTAAAAPPAKPAKAGTRKTVRNSDTQTSETVTEEIRPEREEPYRQQWGLLITCRDEDHQGIALAKLREEGYRVEPVRT